MRIVLALDKFKGSLSALQACQFLAEGVRKKNRKIAIEIKPMADGGDGTADILAANLGLEPLRQEVPDLLNKNMEAKIYWHNTRRLAFIESAEVLGIRRVTAKSEQIFESSSQGFGKLILKAVELLRPNELWLGIGGTMTADAGWGAASIFGLQCFDETNTFLQPNLANMDAIRNIITTDANELLKKTKIIALCDVNAPAFGPGISLASFLPQKGASKENIQIIEKRIRTFWEQVRTIKPNAPKPEDAFMGAGGGLCLGLSAVIPNLQIEHGAQRVAQATALSSCINGADLVVCGEGCLDEQTLYGKTPSIVTQLSMQHNVPVIGVFGKINSPNPENLAQKLGVTEVHTLFNENAGNNGDLFKQSRSKLYEIGSLIAQKYG